MSISQFKHLRNIISSNEIFDDYDVSILYDSYLCFVKGAYNGSDMTAEESEELETLVWDLYQQNKTFEFQPKLFAKGGKLPKFESTIKKNISKYEARGVKSDLRIIINNLNPKWSGFISVVYFEVKN